MSDTRSSQPGRNPIEGRLTERASLDVDFRRALIDNPKSALARELGIDIPDDIHVTVLEESPNQHFIVLPPRSTSAVDSATATGLLRLLENQPVAY